MALFLTNNQSLITTKKTTTMKMNVLRYRMFSFDILKYLNRRLKGLSVCYVLAVAMILCFHQNISAQWSITNSGTFTISFDATVSGVTNGQYAGSGFQSSPSAGQLDSDAWAAAGWSDGDLTFGGTGTTGDYARGNSTGGVGTGGFYSFGSAGDRWFGIQPGGSDFAPGTITLRVQNNTGAPINTFELS